MDITEWFNIRDPAHIQAWAHLQKTGTWPEGFVPDHVTFQTLWATSIMGLMADAFVTDSLAAVVQAPKSSEPCSRFCALPRGHAGKHRHRVTGAEWD